MSQDGAQNTRAKVSAELESWVDEQRRLATALSSLDPEVLEAAIACFESHLAAGLFLIAAAPSLSGRVPVEVASTPEGKKEVLDLIGRIEHSVY